MNDMVLKYHFQKWTSIKTYSNMFAWRHFRLKYGKCICKPIERKHRSRWTSISISIQANRWNWVRQYTFQRDRHVFLKVHFGTYDFYKYFECVAEMTCSNMWNHTSKLCSNSRWRMVRFYFVDGISSQQKVTYWRICNCHICTHPPLSFVPLALTPILNIYTIHIRLCGRFRGPWAL